jgi:hypothetical protein
MSHVRQQVREAAHTLLNTSPTNWQRVFKTSIPPARDVAPYLLVYTDIETSSALDIHIGHLQLRDITLSVRARLRVVDGETLENTMDTVAAEIETKLNQAALKAALSNKLKAFELLSTSNDIIFDENERTYAEVALDWRVQVMTTEGVPETLI